jgi:hypothetical protein
MNESRSADGVTLRELSQLRNLQREIRLDTDRLNRLDMTLYPSVRLNQERAALAPYAAEIREVIRDKRTRCLRERLRLERYIASVDDSLVRMAMTLRFLDGMHWQAVAMRIGGGNTEDSVKKMVYRYIRRHEKMI